MIPADLNTQNYQPIIAPNTDSNLSFEKIFLKAFPNPANQDVTFTYQLPNEIEKGKIHIYDVSGIQMTTIPITENGGKLFWNIEHLQNGVYWSQVTYKGGGLKPQRLIVIK